VRRYMLGLLAVWIMSASACAVGTDEESAGPPTPPRLDGSMGATGGGSGSSGNGSAGWPSGGESGGGGAGGGAAGMPPTGGSGGSSASGTGGGASGGGSTDCNPGQIQYLGGCGKCGTLQKVCEPSGQWGTPSCEGELECMPGDTREDFCGNCGTKTQECNDDCEWDPYGPCEYEGCTPGDKEDCLCSTSGITACCGERVCDDNCQWSTCDLKASSECNWSAGSNFRCCAPGSWEYCLSSCQWSGTCEPCSGCGC